MLSTEKHLKHKDSHALADRLRQPQPARPANAGWNGLRLLRNRSLEIKRYYAMKLILTALAALSTGGYLYGAEAQTAEPGAATGQISKVSPQPDLGSTVAYLSAKYGLPVKVEPAWCGGTAFGFQPTKMTYVYAIESNGVVNDITYFDFNKPQMTQEDAVKSFRSQFPTAPPITWADKEYKNGLGEEKGQHWKHTEWMPQSAGRFREGKSFISNPKDKGWQFRTPEQFAAEQAVIKGLKKKPEQEKGTPHQKSKNK